MKRLLSFILIIALLLPYSIGAQAYASYAQKSNLAGISTETLTGTHIDGSYFSGHKLTILHYFATWSADCLNELNFMQEAYTAFEDQAAVLGLLHEDATSTAEAALSICEELGIEYPTVHLDAILSELVSGADYIPQTFFVDSSGNVIHSFIGTFSDYEVLEAMIEQLLTSNDTYYTVSFYDGLTGGLLKRQRVVHGGTAAPPRAPIHDGYEFDRWDGNYHNVTQNENVYARYIKLDVHPILGDVDGDGSITFADAILIARYSLGVELLDFNFSVADVNEDGNINFNDSLLTLRIALQLVQAPVNQIF